MALYKPFFKEESFQLEKELLRSNPIDNLSSQFFANPYLDGIRLLGSRVFPAHRLLDKGNALSIRRPMREMSAECGDGTYLLTKFTNGFKSGSIMLPMRIPGK